MLLVGARSCVRFTVKSPNKIKNSYKTHSSLVCEGGMNQCEVFGTVHQYGCIVSDPTRCYQLIIVEEYDLIYPMLMYALDNPNIH